jgi:FixJ family two-component response regulator
MKANAVGHPSGSKGLVIILDDEPSIRRSVATLAGSLGYRCAEHAGPETFFAAGEPGEPACLLLDVNLRHRMDGHQVHRELIRLGWALPVIFITADWDVQQVVNSIRAGADDFITKPYEPSHLLEAVARAIDRAKDLRQHSGKARKFKELVENLTSRERDVARLVATGKFNKEIAGELGVSLATVKSHRTHVFDKLGVANATELANILRDTGVAL